MEKRNLAISLFNLNSIKDNSNILIIGMRASGKSTLVRNIVYHKRDCNIGAVFSKTEHVNKFYSDFCPENTIYHEFNKFVVMDMVDKRKTVEEVDFTINIMDDCFSSKTDWTTNQEIVDMMDSNMMNIFCIQFPQLFKQEFLDKIDYIFFMNESFISNRKRLYNYTNVVDNFEDFNRIFNHITTINHYNSLVVYNPRCENQSNIEEQIFWYKPVVDLPEFRIKNYIDKITICNFYKSNDNELFITDSSDFILDDELNEIISHKENNMSQDKSITVGDCLNKRHLLMPFACYERTNNTTGSRIRIEKSLRDCSLLVSPTHSIDSTSQDESIELVEITDSSDLDLAKTPEEKYVESPSIQYNEPKIVYCEPTNIVGAKHQSMTISITQDNIAITKNNISINIKL
jgi:GTPase SAR1 family protein